MEARRPVGPMQPHVEVEIEFSIHVVVLGERQSCPVPLSQIICQNNISLHWDARTFIAGHELRRYPAPCAATLAHPASGHPAT